MSQAFSLYGELTVLQNLELHAHLFHLPKDEIPGRVQSLVDRFGWKPTCIPQLPSCRWVSGNACHWPSLSYTIRNC